MYRFKYAVADMVNILNGENDDPTDDYAYKLVYTGEVMHHNACKMQQRNRMEPTL
jgi:hypothetical protein